MGSQAHEPAAPMRKQSKSFSIQTKKGDVLSGNGMVHSDYVEIWTEDNKHALIPERNIEIIYFDE